MRVFSKSCHSCQANIKADANYPICKFLFSYNMKNKNVVTKVVLSFVSFSNILFIVAFFVKSRWPIFYSAADIRKIRESMTKEN